MLVAFPNVPGPVPKNTLTFPAVRFAETKSTFPSLLRVRVKDFFTATDKSVIAPGQIEYMTVILVYHSTIQRRLGVHLLSIIGFPKRVC